MASNPDMTPDFGDLPPITLEPVEPEVVDLAEIDLDFAGDAPRHTDAASARAAGGIATAQAASADLGALELFHGVAAADLAAFTTQSQIVEVAPGCILQAAGRLSDKIFFVIAGELRLYADLKERRPRGIVDAGQSVGLYWALLRQPTEVAIVATEASHVLALELPQLEQFARRSHALACNFNALLASYLRGDNCLNVGARALAAMHQRRGYTDELTQLHNQHWLDTMLPRLLGRGKFDSAPLSVAMLAVDNFDRINREFGTVAGEEILAAVGQLLINVARTTDLLVYDSGNHFLAILPNTTIEGARTFCRRLHEGIRSLQVGAAEDRPLPSLTFSSGLVQRGGDQSPADLLGNLDTLVRKSIAGGGDRLSE